MANLRQRQGNDSRVEHQQEEARAGASQGPPRPRLLIDLQHGANLSALAAAAETNSE
jgi:hypothetical protein